MDQIIEIRTYVLKAGMAQRFHQIIQEQSLPMLIESGTEVLICQPSVHDVHSYTLVRAYESQAERTKSQDSFYGSQAWIAGPRDAMMACIENYITVVLDADSVRKMIYAA